VSGRAYGYARVSTAQQGEDGYGIAAQVGTLVTMGGVPEEAVVREVGSGGTTDGRPLFVTLVDGMQPGDRLVAAKLDRLGRDTAAILALAARARREGWTLVALDLGLDTSTPVGEFVLTVLAALATMERRLIGTRTREAIAARRAAGGNDRDVPNDVRAIWVDEYRRCRNVSEVHRRHGGGRGRTTVARVLRAELGVAQGRLAHALPATGL
jgi:DNA invertase Pin-like site-specific DNA recombinase